MGGEGALHLGYTFTDLLALPPSRKGPRSLAIEAAAELKEGKEKVHAL